MDAEVAKVVEEADVVERSEEVVNVRDGRPSVVQAGEVMTGAAGGSGRAPSWAVGVAAVGKGSLGDGLECSAKRFLENLVAHR